MKNLSHEPNELIEGRHLVEQFIILKEQAVSVLRRCTLERCHILIDVPKGGPPISACQLIDCTIETKRPMKEAWFFNSDYTRCKFKGKFDGMDFGRSPRPNPLTGEMDKYGELIDCDFTEATLDLCRFFNVDIAKQKFAPWPQFVIPYADELKAFKLQKDWPGTYGVHIRLVPRQNPALVATTGTVKDYLKEYAITLEELEQILEATGGVIR